MTMTMECHNRIVCITMLLGTLGGVASIVLIVLDYRMIGGIMTLSWIPAAIGCLEWRCRERQLRPRGPTRKVVNGRPKGVGPHLAVAEALPTPADIRINIAPNSQGSK